MSVIYYIFSGTLDEPLWLCQVSDLEEAKAHVRAIAKQKPGSYFVFSSDTQSVIYQIDAKSPPQSTAA